MQKLENLYRLIPAIITFSFAGNAFALHPLCQRTLAGTSVTSTGEEIVKMWKSKGMYDNSCKFLRNPLGCEANRQNNAHFTSGPNWNNENLGDVTYIFRKAERVTFLSTIKKIKAPATTSNDIRDFGKNWNGSDDKDLILSRINEFCGASSPEGLTTGCQYYGSLTIRVTAGKRRAPDCEYKFIVGRDSITESIELMNKNIEK